MATPKTSQLANLASQFPAMAQQTSNVQQAQARMAAAEAVRQQAAGKARPVSAAEMGAQLYTAQAAASREAAMRAQRGAAAVGEMELQRQKEEKQKLLFERSRGIQATLRKQEQQLQQLNSQVKANLYDKAMKFEKDELNRTMWKTSQLMDYAVRKTQRAQDYRNLEQRVGMMQKRRTTLLRVAQAKIEQSLKQEFEKTEAARDRDLTDRLMKARADVARKIQDNKNKAAEQSAAWIGGGQILGQVIGTIVGGAIIAGGVIGSAGTATPAAIAAGAYVGGEVGKGLGGAAGAAAKPGAPAGGLSREEIRAKIRGGR